MSGTWLPDCSKLAIKWKNNNDVTICRHDIIVKYCWCCFVFLVSLVTGPSFKSISSLVLELWQFSFIRDWPEIRKSDITPSEFCPISGDRGELEILNFARMSLIKCYQILLKKNQQGGKNYPPPHPGGGGVKLTFCPIQDKKWEIHFKEVRLSFSSVWKLICYWFDKSFVEAATNIFPKNQVLFGGILVPKSNQHNMLSNFISNSCDVFRFCRSSNIFQN